MMFLICAALFERNRNIFLLILNEKKTKASKKQFFAELKLLKEKLNLIKKKMKSSCYICIKKKLNLQKLNTNYW